MQLVKLKNLTLFHFNMKKLLIEELCVFLLRKGFTTKIIHYCFDILARKDSNVLLIKVVEDANSLNPNNAKDMLKITSYTTASPLIIAEKSGQKLQDNVVYSRFGISTINLKTFENSVNNKLPFIKSNKSGLAVSIIGKKLQNIRENLDLSYRDLSRIAHVSPRMISRYENEDAEISLKKAISLYKKFGSELFKEINIFEPLKFEILDDKPTKFTKKFQDLGFAATEIKKVPFNIIAKKEREIILTKTGDRIDHELLLISKLMDTNDLVIFDKKRPKDIPSLSEEEFMEIKKAKELIKLIKEF